MSKSKSNSTRTTIQIQKATAHRLKENREHPRESYDEIIIKLLQFYEQTKSHNQYDKFLYKIQQMKMQELWDNPDDEIWNSV